MSNINFNDASDIQKTKQSIFEYISNKIENNNIELLNDSVVIKGLYIDCIKIKPYNIQYTGNSTDEWNLYIHTFQKELEFSRGYYEWVYNDKHELIGFMFLYDERSTTPIKTKYFTNDDWIKLKTALLNE